VGLSAGAKRQAAAGYVATWDSESHSAVRVLNVNKFYYPRGGSEQYFFFVERELRRRGHEVVPFAMQHPDNLPSPFSDYFAEPVDYFSGGVAARARAALRVIYSRDARRRLARLLDATRPDVAHLHVFQQQLSHSILPELKRRGIPILYTAHDFKAVCPNYQLRTHDGFCERCLGGHFHHCTVHRCVKGSLPASLVATAEMYVARMKGWYDLVDRFHTPSRFHKDKLEAGGIRGDRITVLPLACDLQRFTPHGADDGYMVFAGRLVEEKGILTLLDAVQGLGRRPPLKILGTGPLDAVLRQRTAACGLRDVEFLGYQTGEVLRRLLAGAMFFVVPSEVYENTPVVIYEAMSLGKPVIGARIGGIPEMIVDGDTGLLVEPGDAAALGAAIERLASDAPLRQLMGRQARVRAEQVYAPDAHLDRLLELYAACGGAPARG